MNKLQLLVQNKHTTGAAAFYALCELLTIWFPDYKPQLDATKNWALVYGLLLAGDSKPINGTHHETAISNPSDAPTSTK